eukprot:gene22905-29082_t
MSSSYGAELLRRQLMELSRNPPDGVSVGLGDDENIFNWELMIIGPPDTLYEGGFFKAKLDFPSDFPNAPPETAVERWRPILGVESIILSVISMLSDPNDESPANIDAAVMWRNDKAAFKKKVKSIVRRSQEDM